MAGILDKVDQRTQLAGHNRLELLLFRLGGRQLFAMNVFKIREVVQCPPLTQLPESHPAIRGVAHMRDITIPVMDLAMAIRRPPLDGLDQCSVIVSEYNRQVQGFLVSGIERIVNITWKDVLPPPSGSGGQSYITAVTRHEDQIIQIIDVEKIMSEVMGEAPDVSDETRARVRHRDGLPRRILVADDSCVARNQVQRTLEAIGYECLLANNGREALDTVRALAAEGPIHQQLAMVISDVEMPEMDGYTLTTELRRDERTRDLYVMLHSSLSGVFNYNMVESVGANKFIAKFDADALADGIMQALEEIVETAA